MFNSKFCEGNTFHSATRERVLTVSQIFWSLYADIWYFNRKKNDEDNLGHWFRIFTMNVGQFFVFQKHCQFEFSSHYTFVLQIFSSR